LKGGNSKDPNIWERGLGEQVQKRIEWGKSQTKKKTGVHVEGGNRSEAQKRPPVQPGWVSWGR